MIFYIEELIANYEKLLIQAINENEFSLVECILIKGSKLYISQKNWLKIWLLEILKKSLLHIVSKILNTKMMGQ